MEVFQTEVTLLYPIFGGLLSDVFQQEKTSPLSLVSDYQYKSSGLQYGGFLSVRVLRLFFEILL